MRPALLKRQPPEPNAVLDQATELRRLVREAAPAVFGRGCARPRLVAVAGGAGGIGTTTLAVNLAVALAQAGRRTILADASPSGRDAAVLCGLDRQRGAIDRPIGESNLADLIQPGPGGLRILAKSEVNETPWRSLPIADCLLDHLATLSSMADWVVVDAGNSPGRQSRRLWRAADAILLVATPELTSVMNAYAAVKSLAPPDAPPEVFSVVSRASAAAAAEEIHARLAQACRRFLGIRLRHAGYVPAAIEIEEAGRRGEPFILASPGSLASRQILAISRRIASNET